MSKRNIHSCNGCQYFYTVQDGKYEGPANTRTTKICGKNKKSEDCEWIKRRNENGPN